MRPFVVKDQKIPASPYKAFGQVVGGTKGPNPDEMVRLNPTKNNRSHGQDEINPVVR